MATTELTVSAIGDLQDGIRVADLTDKLRTDWSDATLTITVTGTGAGKPGSDGVISDGTLTIHSASPPSGGEVTALETWCGSHVPNNGMDATYTNIPRPELCAEGTVLLGDDGDKYPVMQIDGAWVKLATGEPAGAPLVKSVSAGGIDTLSTGDYVLVDNMTITPGAGTWMLMFTAEIDTDIGEWVYVAAFYDGVEISNSEIKYENGTADIGCALMVPAIVTADAKAVEIRAYAEASSSAHISKRNMALLAVST